MQPGNNPTPARESTPPEPAMPAQLLEYGLPYILNDAADPALVLDRNKFLVFSNRAATRFFGESLRPGEPIYFWDENTWERWLRRTLVHGEIFSRLPLTVKDADGATRSLTASLSPIRQGFKSPEGCLLVFREETLDLQNFEAIQLKGATLASILDNFPTPFFLVDPNLIITHINERMEKLTGYSREEVVGRMSCGALLNTPHCGAEGCVLRMVMQQKHPVPNLRRVVRDRQGREIPVVVSASLITDHTGKVIGGFEAVRDITPIIEAEKKVELLSELTREGILMVDENQRILFANSQMEKIIGVTKEDLMGLDLGEVITPHHKRSAADLARMVQEGYHWDLQFCNTLEPSIASEGEPRVFETSMAGTRLGDQIIIYVYLRDLSFRVKLSRELLKNISFLNNIIQCSVDGIVVVDRKGVPLIFNEGAERILGYKAEEVVGHPEVFRRFYPEDVAQEMMRRMRSPEFGPKDKLNTTLITFIHKNGEEVPILFSAAIVREHNKEVGSVGIFSDMRETLKLRQKLEESQTQLLQAEKIASLGRLSAGVAHEINNPLAGILIYAELLRRDMDPAFKGKEFVDEIINQTMRCQQIVNRLLEFSRQSKVQRTLLDLNTVVDRVVELILHQALFHDIKVVRNLDPELPQFMGDPGQLQQVLANLLINAADALQGHGTITITTRPGPEKEGVILTFSDTGPGIPAYIRDKIFEPFFTTKPVGKGTGLGLSIVYSVIQRHGGTIEVDSRPGVGTTFTIRLPQDLPEEEDTQFALK
jgi:two-component system, NtrC family, sensor kinase